MLTFTVDDEFFELIKSGAKTIEGRLPRFGVADLKIGDYVLIRDYSGNSMIVQVVSLKHYPSIALYLMFHLHEALPNTPSIREGLEIYRRFISPQTEAEEGIVAIGIQRSDAYVIEIKDDEEQHKKETWYAMIAGYAKNFIRLFTIEEQ